MMRIESAVSSVSWIRSEAAEGISKLPFATGVAHYDDPPAGLVEDVKRFCALPGDRLDPVMLAQLSETYKREEGA